MHFQAIGAVVDNLDALDMTLTPLLLDLGRQHARGLVLQMDAFDFFHETMVKIWETELGSKFTQEARDTWNAVFYFMLQKMKEGYQMEKQEQGVTTHGLATRHTDS